MAQTHTYTERSVVVTGSDTGSGTPELVMKNLIADADAGLIENVKVVRFVIEAADGATGRVVKITHEDTGGTQVEIFNRTVNTTDQYILDRNAGGFGEWMRNPRVSTAANSGDVTVQMIYE